MPANGEICSRLQMWPLATSRPSRAYSSQFHRSVIVEIVCHSQTNSLSSPISILTVVQIELFCFLSLALSYLPSKLSKPTSKYCELSTLILDCF